MINWLDLPSEIRLTILDNLAAQHTALAPYTTVNTEFQNFVEAKIFHALTLEMNCLWKFEELASRHRQFVKRIYLNIELPSYGCKAYSLPKVLQIADYHVTFVSIAIQKLFSVLASWPEGDGLALEIGTYCLSDSQHFFQNSFFGIPGELLKHQAQLISQKAIEDPEHGWVGGKQCYLPIQSDIHRIFGPKLYDLPYLQNLPCIRAVTSFIVRRQCRRRLNISKIVSKFPRLKRLHFEPWQAWSQEQTLIADLDFQNLITTYLPKTVREVTIFEETDEKYVLGLQKDQVLLDSVRIPDAAVSATFASASRTKTHIALSSMVEAHDFFQACKPDWTWPRLEELSLTSRYLDAEQGDAKVSRLLLNAAEFANRMPKLRSLIIWVANSRGAAMFRYDTSGSRPNILWRGSWIVKLDSSIIRA